MILFFTIYLLILYDIYKNTQFWKKKLFFWKIPRKFNFAVSLFRKISREFHFADSWFQKILRELNFVDFGENHEIRKIFFPRKFLPLRYLRWNLIYLLIRIWWVQWWCSLFFVLDRKKSFLANLSQTIKVVCF